MRHYGCTLTQKGRALIVKLLAAKTPLVMTRVMVGAGTPKDEDNPAELEHLIEPIAAATATTPVYDGDTVHMTIEYRSDLNGGLERGFWLNEFCVYAEDPDEGEIMLYYGTLGEYPQWVGAYTANSVDVRRYPISIVVGEEATVVIDFSPEAFVTLEEVAEYCTAVALPQYLDASDKRLASHDASESAHAAIQNRFIGFDARLTLLELTYITDVRGNPFTVTFDSLDGLRVQGVWNADQKRIEF